MTEDHRAHARTPRRQGQSTLTGASDRSRFIKPAYPDYPRIRALVQEALRPTTAGGDATAPAPAPATSAAPTPATPSAPLSAAPAPAGNGGVAAQVTDACAYNPAQAAAELAAGEPENQGH